MTFDPTKPVQTRGGLPARIITAALKGAKDYPIAAIVEDEYGEEYVETYTPGGYLYGIAEQNDRDLVNAPETVTSYVNLGAGYGCIEAAKRYSRGFDVVQIVREKGTTKVLSAEIVPA